MADTPKELIDLVERFKDNIESYRSGKYGETQVRREFIDPFFKLLGWDIDNTQGHAEWMKEVVHEDSIEVEGGLKAPDYCFRVGGSRMFFLEAKKPSVNIKDDQNAAFQVRRYGWSAKLPVSILTDFEEFAVYDCSIRPLKGDKSSAGRIFYCTYDEYQDKWNELKSIFSKEAVLKGSFHRYVQSDSRKKGTESIDKAFLKEIENWRSLLAKNLALRNKDLSEAELNDSVQRIIDRIVFLRICEDRGLEQYGLLRETLSGGNVYDQLKDLFRRADEKYNSGLFYFRDEPGREGSPDKLTPSLSVDDKILKQIIGHLYYPESPFVFSEIPPDILGQIYEQFLGKVISLTAGHSARIEEKPEVKKAGGVFYTPSFIVDYIVKATLEPFLGNSKPEDFGGGINARSSAAGKKLRILDPACGSGTFLIQAYQYLLDWYLKSYVSSGPSKMSRGEAAVIYQDKKGEWRLSSQERKRILLKHIFGTDIDEQAVEVTKLSLLLKVLEGETAESIDAQLQLIHERALPDLSGNIRCGNALVGTDFPQLNDLFESSAQARRIRPFDWSHEFPTIFSGANEGFEAIIGNPPYVRQELLGPFKDYFKVKYPGVYSSAADLYTYFIERSMELLASNGRYGIIVANKWMRAGYGEKLREWLKNYHVEELIDFGDTKVFEKATTYPLVLRARKAKPEKELTAANIRSLDFVSLEGAVRDQQFKVSLDSLRSDGWNLVDKRSSEVFEKIQSMGVPLGEFVEGRIYRGILTGLNAAFVIDEQTKERLIKEDKKSGEIIKPFLAGRDIKRYADPLPNKYLLLIENGFTSKRRKGAPWKWFKDEYPAVAAHLSRFEKEGKARYDQGEYWWELRACDYYSAFRAPKIIVPAIVRSASYAYSEAEVYSNDKSTIIGSDSKYLLGVLNSSVSDFFLHAISSTKQGGYFEYKPMYISQIPIAVPGEEVSKSGNLVATVEKNVEQILEVHGRRAKVRSATEEQELDRMIHALDARINQAVYEIYGLSEEEIGIIEKGR